MGKRFVIAVEFGKGEHSPAGSQADRFAGSPAGSLGDIAMDVEEESAEEIAQRIVEDFAEGIAPPDSRETSADCIAPELVTLGVVGIGSGPKIEEERAQ